MFFVYVLRNKEKKLYVGYTKNLEQRIREHNSNHNGHTGKGDWECVYYEAFLDERDARARERQLKNNGNAKRWLKERIRNSMNCENS